MQLSAEQQIAFSKIQRGANTFVTGQAGTGKTQLIKAIVNHANDNCIPFHVCAMTGCAAILLGDGATTLHSFFGIGLAVGDSRKIVSSAINKSHKMKKLRSIRLLIIDEVSMMSKKLFEIIQTILREARGTRFIGNIQLVFTGDFMQLPPIETAGDPDTAMFCFQSSSWNDVFLPENQIELRTIFRQEDPVYRQVLMETRMGVLSESSLRVLESRLRVPFCPEDHNGCIPTKIFATRANVDHVNRVQYAKLTEPEFVFEAARIMNATTYLENNTPIPTEILRVCESMPADDKIFEMNKLFDTSNFVNIFRVKVGAVVMCIANVDLEIGICNGSQGIVIGMATTFFGEIPIVRFHNGVVRQMSHHKIQSQEFPAFIVSQIPLVHAWAISIHKCQGATMDIAEIDVGNTIFEFGQTYVALSRVKTLSGLYLSNLDVSKIRTNPIVQTFYSNLARYTAESPTILDATTRTVSDFSSFAYDSVKVVKLA